MGCFSNFVGKRFKLKVGSTLTNLPPTPCRVNPGCVRMGLLGRHAGAAPHAAAVPVSGAGLQHPGKPRRQLDYVDAAAVYCYFHVSLGYLLIGLSTLIEYYTLLRVKRWTKGTSSRDGASRTYAVSD